jgi:hypothetical protein
MIAGGLEGCGPSQPRLTESTSFSTAPRGPAPSRGSASNAHPAAATMTGGLDALRSLAAAAYGVDIVQRGAEGADALQLQGIFSYAVESRPFAESATPAYDVGVGAEYAGVQSDSLAYADAP